MTQHDGADRDITLPADADPDTRRAMGEAPYHDLDDADQDPGIDVAQGTTGFLGAGSPNSRNERPFDE